MGCGWQRRRWSTPNPSLERGEIIFMFSGCLSADGHE